MRRKKMMLLVFLLLSSVCSTAQTLSCSQPLIFGGKDDGNDLNFAFQTTCVTVSWPLDTLAHFASTDVTYTLLHSVQLADITVWMGTPQGSIQESAGDVAFEVPTDTPNVFRTVRRCTVQKDKHFDLQGEQFQHCYNGFTYALPAGTRVRVLLNIGILNYAQSCPSVGCGEQINVYIQQPPTANSGGCLGGTCPL